MDTYAYITIYTDSQPRNAHSSTGRHQTLDGSTVSPTRRNRIALSVAAAALVVDADGRSASSAPNVMRPLGTAAADDDVDDWLDSAVAAAAAAATAAIG